MSVNTKIESKGNEPKVIPKPAPIVKPTITPAKQSVVIQAESKTTGNKIEAPVIVAKPTITQVYAPKIEPIITNKIEAPVINQVKQEVTTPIKQVTQATSNKIEDDMAWKPKTIAGKIIKGAVIGGGSILGLASGVGIVGGAVRGVGAAKGAATGIGGLVKVVDKVGQGAVNLVTGTTKDERTQINEIKKETKAEQDKLEQVDRLIKAGATPEKAKAMVGIKDAELTMVNGKQVQSAGIGDIFASPVVMYGALAAGVYFLLKVLKIIK